MSSKKQQADQKRIEYIADRANARSSIRLVLRKHSRRRESFVLFLASVVARELEIDEADMVDFCFQHRRDRGFHSL